MTMSPQTILPAGQLHDRYLGVRLASWIQLAVLAVAFVVFHRDYLLYMYSVARTNQDWSHAFVVPLISLYFVYLNWDHILEAARNSSVNMLGMLVTLAGAAGYVAAIYPMRVEMFQGYAMIVTLLGLVFWLGGWAMLRVLWFPVVYLVFAVRIAEPVWRAFGFELQNIAARTSVIAINILGIPFGIEAEGRGNTIDLWHHYEKLGNPLNVADACSGLRMLMAFIALGAAVAYLADRPWWARIILVLLTVPIAILINVGRVTALGLIHPYNSEMSTGDFHLFLGILMLLPALGLFLLIGWILNQLVIEEDPSATD